jgi:hypothetical protein
VFTFDPHAHLNSGYKAVPRCEWERMKRLELCEVCAPAALAAIRALNPVTEDRAIPVTIQRGRDARRAAECRGGPG